MRFRMIVTACAVFALSTVTDATVPPNVTVQGKLTDTVGVPLPAGDKSFVFRIFNASSGGSQMWPLPDANGEPQTIHTDANGLWIGLLGIVNPLNAAIFFDQDSWLEITVEGTILPRTRLVTVPHAFHVSTVDGAEGGTITSKVSIGPAHTNTGVNAFIAGEDNVATGDRSAVTGGDHNTATGMNSTIGGGELNQAHGQHSTVSGGYKSVASNSFSTVGGGYEDTASGSRATVAGGQWNVASGNWSTVGGGGSNYATNLVATVAGGNRSIASGQGATVGGGEFNRARGTNSTISGGGGPVLADSNTAMGEISTVCGGRRNIASGFGSTIGGGGYNRADSSWTTVSGGYNCLASNLFCTVGGGYEDTASGSRATVGGGQWNVASGDWSTVGGGGSNYASNYVATVAGGNRNIASGPGATVGGGEFDTVSGDYATIPGGSGNKASGHYSLAAGRRAKALHVGTFIWSDSSNSDFASTAQDQFLIRASGGVGVGTNAPESPLHIAEGSAGAVTAYTNAVAAFERNGNAYLHLLSPNADENGLLFGTPLANLGGAVIFNSNLAPSGLEFRTNTNDFAMAITASGRMGIGTSAIPNILTLPNVASVDGRGLANAWSLYSSRRWKTDIHTIEDALGKVEQLRGVTYRPKDGGNEQIGMIAEEVGEVVPQVVQYEANGVDAQSIDYARLVALLVEGMKEQQKRIEALEKKLEHSTP